MWECDLLDPESETAAASDGRSTYLGVLKSHLSKVQFELPAVELWLVQLDAGAGGGLRGAEVYPDSTEAFEKLEGGVLVVDPKQGLEPLLYRLKTGNKMRNIWQTFEQPASFSYHQQTAHFECVI